MERSVITSEKVKRMENTVEINVDGKDYLVSVKAYDTLSRVLRDELGLFGVKRGCDYGGCGACTVSLDGRAVYSCMYPVQNIVGKKVLTVEGLAHNGDVSHEALSDIEELSGEWRTTMRLLHCWYNDVNQVFA